MGTRARIARYDASPKGRAARAAYLASPIGKALNSQRQRRWRDKNPDYMKIKGKEFRARGLAIVDKIKLGGCVDCGNKDIRVLEFDHVPERGPKKYGIMGVLASTGALKAELAKCDVVCANCHAIRTRERGQNWRSL